MAHCGAGNNLCRSVKAGCNKQCFRATPSMMCRSGFPATDSPISLNLERTPTLDGRLNFRPATKTTHGKSRACQRARTSTCVRPAWPSCALISPPFAARAAAIKLVIAIPTRHAECLHCLNLMGVASSCRGVFQGHPTTASPIQPVTVGIIWTYRSSCPRWSKRWGCTCRPGNRTLRGLGAGKQIATLLADVDVVIYASGSEAVLERLPKGSVRHRVAAAPKRPDSVKSCSVCGGVSSGRSD